MSTKGMQFTTGSRFQWYTEGTPVMETITARYRAKRTSSGVRRQLNCRAYRRSRAGRRKTAMESRSMPREKI